MDGPAMLLFAWWHAFQVAEKEHKFEGEHPGGEVAAVVG